MRTAQRADQARMRQIWRACFGDGDDYIDFFLSRCFVPENTLLCTADERIVSQLFLLPTALRAGAHCVPIYYLFAAATDPAYRRRGLMERLLREADALSARRGRQAIVLLPGDPALYAYYAKHGYATAFYRRTATLSQARAFAASAERATAVDTEPIPFLQAFLWERDGVEWDAAFLRYALDEHSRFRGTFACAGGAFACREGDTAAILATSRAITQGVSLLTDVCGMTQGTLILPPDAPFGTLCDAGMIRWIGDALPLHDAFIPFPME